MKISVSCLGAMKKADKQLETTEGREDKTSHCSSKSPGYTHIHRRSFPVPPSPRFFEIYLENAHGRVLNMTSSTE